MRTPFTRKLLVASAAFIILGLLNGCASQPATKKEAKELAEKKTVPTPQVMHVPAPAKATPGSTTPDQTVPKDLFNINLSPSGIKVNGVKVANVAALDKLLSKYNKPIITIATHRCYNNEAAAKVISLAQSHTATPIAIGSFGDYSDPQCQ